MDFKMDQVRYVEAQNLIQDGTEQKRKEFTTFIRLLLIRKICILLQVVYHKEM